MEIGLLDLWSLFNMLGTRDESRGLLLWTLSQSLQFRWGTLKQNKINMNILGIIDNILCLLFLTTFNVHSYLCMHTWRKTRCRIHLFIYCFVGLFGGGVSSTDEFAIEARFLHHWSEAEFKSIVHARLVLGSAGLAPSSSRGLWLRCSRPALRCEGAWLRRCSSDGSRYLLRCSSARMLCSACRGGGGSVPRGAPQLHPGSVPSQGATSLRWAVACSLRRQLRW